MIRSLMLLALIVPLSVAANDRPAKLVFCHEDQNSYPWVMKDRSGLNIHLLRLVERDLSIPFEFISVPWKRCLVELTAGRVDGAFAASFKTERMEMGLYPGADQSKPDPAKRLHMSSYSLYRMKGTDLDWDGAQFVNLRGPIGILSGFSVGDFLKQKGATVDEGSKSPEDTLRKLVAGRMQGAALQTPRAERLLQLAPDLARQIERVPVPLEERPYYVMLSFALAKRYPQFAADLWNRIAITRESPEYKRIEQEFYSAP